MFALDLQNIHTQISERLQLRIEVSGLGLVTNELCKHREIKCKVSNKYYVPETPLGQGQLRRE